MTDNKAVIDLRQDEMKHVVDVYRHGSQHWVGDGFPVRNLIPGDGVGEQLSPFLLLDYAWPAYFPPTDAQRGVGEHPHRGFETVTVVYEGVVAHRDSAGNGGIIGPGDVQWMTAASGIVHEEMHEPAWAKRGGTLHTIQLWVNLPKAFKMSKHGYQTLLNDEIPTAELEDGAGQARIIAGEFRGIKGPAKTVTPVHLYDLRVKAGQRTDVTAPASFNTAVFVLQGRITVNGERTVGDAELARFGRRGERIAIEAKTDTILLVLSGEPIDEPVARYGPFVMNTQAELAQAVNDYRAGKMGHLD
jgi:hypothetical protein